MTTTPELLPAEYEVLSRAQFFTHGCLPAVAAYCRRLGIVELVNALVPTQMRLKPGLVVQAMVLDTLSGRTPLYHLEDFMANQDIELLIGEKVESHAFNDTNIARSLDAIFASGTSKIITELGIRATNIFHLDATVPSYDTTSTSVWGDYAACEFDTPPPGPVLTYGHSKDNQPQLKQFMTELLCIERGIPIFSQTLDGNSSDKTSNNEMLSRISSIMAQHKLGVGAFVYVADSAVVTRPNLESIGDNKLITRLPANYSECQRVIEEAVTANEWTDIGRTAETRAASSRPHATYKACESSVVLYEKPYRAIVVHSSAHDKRRKKKLEKAIAASAKEICAELDTIATVFHCEADARAAMVQMEKLSRKLHSVQALIKTEEVRLRGRPALDTPPLTRTKYIVSYEVSANALAIEKEQTLTGCFVLLTNVPKDGENAMSAKEILETYKGQYGVESNFGFLKDPLIVNDLFLKTPSRIDALGMVLVIALMVWRLMERSMRTYLENNNKEITGWEKRQTKKPTAFMMSKSIVNIKIALVGKQRVIMGNIRQKALDYLEALGLNKTVFTDCSAKCQAIIKAEIG
jgi:transposase